MTFDPSLLDQTSSSPYIIVAHSIVNSPISVVSYLLRNQKQLPDSVNGFSKQSDLVVTTLRPPSAFTHSTSSSSSRHVDILDLTLEIPGYPGISSLTSGGPLENIFSEYESRRGTIVIDSVDILVEDHGIVAVVHLIKQLLAVARDEPSPSAPSRIILTIPSHSPFLTYLTSPSLSPSLSLLTPHQAAHLESLSSSYLAPLGTERFWTLLEVAKERGWDIDLSHRGAAGGYAYGKVGKIHNSGFGWDKNRGNGVGDVAEVVQVLIRRAVGGAKGMLRGLEGLRDGEILPLTQVARIDPLSSGFTMTHGPGGAGAKTHADLNLPFNLSLTDRQREERLGVPLPYAHEGEGGDRLGAGMDWEEDEEDEEV